METGGTGTNIDFDAWCDLSARLFERTPEEQLAILEERGVSEDAWLDATTRWQRALSEDTRARRPERAERYGAAFDAELRRRGEVALSPAEKEAAAPAPPPAPETAPPDPAGPAPMTAAWLSDRAVETADGAVENSQSAAPPAAPPVSAAASAEPPPVTAAPAAAASAEPPPFVAPRVTFGEETLAVGSRAAPAPALPFDPGSTPRWPVAAPGAQPPGSVPRPAPAGSSAPGEETLGPGATSPVARAALPFTAEGPRPSAQPPPAQPLSTRPAPAQAPSGQAPSAQPLSARPSPAQAPSSQAPSGQAPSSQAPSGQAPSAQPPAVGEETIAAGAVSPVALRSLPFSGSGPPKQAEGPASRPVGGTTPGPRLTLEQFAALSAELSMYPDSAAQVRARWGMTEATHKAETAAWAAAFRQDPALYGRFRAASDHYRAWGEQSRGR